MQKLNLSDCKLKTDINNVINALGSNQCLQVMMRVKMVMMMVKMVIMMVKMVMTMVKLVMTMRMIMRQSINI